MQSKSAGLYTVNAVMGWTLVVVTVGVAGDSEDSSSLSLRS